jgi:hypothetical protein
VDGLQCINVPSLALPFPFTVFEDAFFFGTVVCVFGFAEVLLLVLDSVTGLRVVERLALDPMSPSYTFLPLATRLGRSLVAMRVRIGVKLQIRV